MRNLIIVSLSLLAISAITISMSSPSTSGKVYCQILSETHYDADGEITRDEHYNYDGKELLSVNDQFGNDKIYTNEDAYNRAYRYFPYPHTDINLHNEEKVNEYGEMTYAVIHNTDVMKISFIHEYEEYVVPGINKTFCRKKSTTLDVDCANGYCFGYHSDYNYDGNKLVSYTITNTKGKKTHRIDYLTDNKRKMPHYNGYSIETLNEYGKVILSEQYTTEGKYNGKTVYTYIMK